MRWVTKATGDIPAFSDIEPIRSELFGLERLADHARSLARERRQERMAPASTTLLDRLNANARSLAACYAATVKMTAQGRPIAPAAEWLIDNFHLVEKQIRKIRDDMPPDYYRQLPKVANGPLATLPRAFELAWAYVAHSDSHFERDRFQHFVAAYQRSYALTIGELWAMAIMLQLVLVENLRRLADEGIADERERQEADNLAIEVLAAPDPARAVARLSASISEVRPILHSQLALRLRFDDPLAVESRRWLDQHAQAAGTSLAALDAQAQQRFVAATTSVRNVIMSIRMVAEADWGAFVEAVSLSDRLLAAGSDFAAMDFATRNLYRNAIEELARGSDCSEDRVAEIALKLSAQDASRNRSDRDPGYWLLRDGRAALEAEIGFVPGLTARLQRLLRQGRLGLYIGLIALLAVVTLSIVFALTGAAETHWAFGLLLLGVGAVITLETSTALVNRAYAMILPPQLVPAMALEGGIPPELRTLVVVPVLIGDAAQLKAAITDLEVLHLGAREPEVFYALLSDFADAASEHLAGEDALLTLAGEQLSAINARHAGTGDTPRFFLLHRRRLWNAREGVWMGWERKRGKLEELNRLLRGGEGTSYERDGAPPAVPAGVRYVVTLDQDTRLPPGTIRRLVGKMAHPVNRPRFDIALRRVVGGHGVMQPRVTTALPLGRGQSVFERLTGGPAGTDPYAAAASDLYQDLLGEGSFTGKGIYEVDSFMAALHGRVPENRLLSHDLFEGSFARAALVSDIEVVEDVPVRYDAAARRMHRWVRGDWQLLPWLLAHGKGGVPFEGRAKMLDNLRRSVVAPAAFTALVAGWFLPPFAAAPWMLAILVLMAVSPMLGVPSLLLAAIPRNVPLRLHLRDVAEDVALALASGALMLLTLADQAVRMVDAIVRTLWRLAVSGRHLLEWQTAAQAARAPAPTGPALARWMATSLLLVATLAGLALWLGARPWLVLPLALLWLSAPLVLAMLGRPAPLASAARLSPGDRAALEEIARESWGYFATYATAEHNHLPPDNVQFEPVLKVADRTSPTNIGLYLLAVATAHDRGWIDRSEALERLGGTFDTLARMTRHRGHLFNWYDTRSLQVLEPPYVSTVDSGNFAGHLIALANLLDAWDAPEAARLAAHARAEVAGMPFDFLVDPERRLLSIGWSVTDSRRDESCYDLLASEARLASLVAIARGDISAKHWARLGRSATRVGRFSVLISWSGSMFEYLMPSLVMRAADCSLLERSNRAMLTLQRAHGEAGQIPWGVSESGFNARDRELNYQYGPFGVPGLGLKRGLSGNLVIAPYATALAAMVDARAALANFEALERLGARGTHGFYEALDFTPQRLAEGQRFAIVRSHMAHHQGMAMLALVNVLDGARLRDAFHAEPMVAAVDLLLQERPPRGVGTFEPREEERSHAYRSLAPQSPTVRRYGPHPGRYPALHLLASGSYGLIVTDSGGGTSSWRGLALNRWRPDPVVTGHGQFLYCVDHTAGLTWSATRAPLGADEATGYSAQFGDGRAEFHRRDGRISTSTDILVAPDGEGEVRRVTLSSQSSRAHAVDVASFMELAMAQPGADLAHPAFSKLFIETEVRPGPVLIARRRPRSPDEPPVHMAHFAVVEGAVREPADWDTDRGSIIGRGRGIANPAMLDDPMAGNAGTVIDPAFALRVRLTVPPGGRVRVAFWTVVAPDPATLDEIIDRHASPDAFDRAEVAAWTRVQVERRYLGLDTGERADFQRLARHVLFGGHLAPDAALVEAHAGPQSSLWVHGISGDRPILLVRLDDPRDLPVAAELLRAFEFFRGRLFDVDLVILNERRASYIQDLQAAIDAAVAATIGRMGGSHGRLFALRGDLMSEEQRLQLVAAARVDIDARRGRLRRQLDGRSAAAPRPVAPLPPAAPQRPGRAAAAPPPESALLLFNGIGGFAPDGQSYVIAGRTPAPWLNVLANPHFGCHVSADATGAIWAGNARENQLTPWSNDPVGDPGGDTLYLRDAASRLTWSASAWPCGAPGGRTTVHGFGFTRQLLSAHDIDTDLLLFVPPDDPVRIARLTLRNTGTRTRMLDVTGYAEWVLGPNRTKTARHLVTSICPETGAILARNPFATENSGQVAFADLGGAQTSFTADRTSFLGPDGDPSRPAALASPGPLSGGIGAGLDPCAALQGRVVLAPGQSAELLWLIGTASDGAEVSRIVRRWRDADLDAALAATRAQWNDILGQVQVETPDPAFNLMMNGWLLHQVVAGRLWGRAGFYQASGAYGFRDQLQDGGALLLARPDMARPHLLRAAGRQFPEGDVQHWWLPESGRGVRTRISDDTGWLALSVADYVDATGDATLLDEPLPFLTGPTLEPGIHDSFFLPGTSTEQAPLFEHCARALDRALSLIGDNGLPLIGTGDWNDGMNRVGEHGRGTSVWLAWHLIHAVDRFAPLADARAPEKAADWRDRTARIREAVAREAWDGEWYRRATYDDGSWLGTRESAECRIDAIAQSWAVISGAAAPERARAAMASLDRHLVDRDAGILRLFAPPFDRGARDPGYIKGYPPGLRENGGQYSHGAMWAIIAKATLGDIDGALALFDLVNPVNHALTPEAAARYRVEPYAVAADIYSVEPHVGRGGWTWYTGAAGWMYRAGIGSIIGLSRSGHQFQLRPALPSGWDRIGIVMRSAGGGHRITVQRVPGLRTQRATRNGETLEAAGGAFRWSMEAGQHEIIVNLPGAP
ncbi:GH36-type glycosyl hydrolase domain-containing protein [Sandaracinobacteroides saxicola]|nr:glucoamylase family protein [Sandaracinobacteroides saxicola]